jgi:hypothetical protein
MHRRLPHESRELLAELTSWIEWRYANSKERLVLTSAPTALPCGLERWMPSAVWRLVWLGSGAAILYGLAPGSGPTRYFVLRHDTTNPRREGLFQKLTDGAWSRVDGDALEPGAKSVSWQKIVRRYRLRRRASLSQVLPKLRRLGRALR